MIPTDNPKTFIGNPCKLGHTERYLSGGDCVACMKARAHAQELAHKAKGIKRVRNPEERQRTFARYYRRNTQRQVMWTRVRRARRRGAGGWHTPTQVLELFARQRGKCIYCRTSLKDGYDEDHIVPIARGGTNDIANIQLLCPRCNGSKGARDPIVFAQQRGFLL